MSTDRESGRGNKGQEFLEKQILTRKSWGGHQAKRKKEKTSFLSFSCLVASTAFSCKKFLSEKNKKPEPRCESSEGDINISYQLLHP
jgi:hypothetical protein